MALHYNLKECNLEGVPDNIVTEMIYCTMVIEIGHFTEKNIKDVFYRISIAEMFNGFPFHIELNSHGSPKSILADMDLLKKFIGLKTNVGTTPMRKWFSTKLKQQEKINNGKR
jgi:hypothetical protein|tara:strand:+ start:123 stop:461 length:339 start_codon:yes stop_codon:yes gene_type:complete